MRRPAVLWLLLFAAIPIVSTASGPDVPALLLSLGYGGTVTAVDVDPHPAPPLSSAAKASSPAAKASPGSLQCAAQGGFVLVAPTPDANGHPFCITASVTQGLGIMFTSQLPFVTPKQLNCTALHGAASAPGTDLIAVIARVGYPTASNQVRYDGGRAECDVGSGFAYTLSVETQTASAIVPAGTGTRTIVIPWTQLHLDRHATRIMMRIDICDGDAQCAATPTYVFIPLERVGEHAESVTLANAPFVRYSTPAPKPGATPSRAHRTEADAAYSWDQHDLLSTAFAQDQSEVTAQRALSQALSLTQVPLPASAGLTQSIQTQSQTLFAFQMSSDMLEDPSLKGLFDILPFAVTRINSLASGYAYGYTSNFAKVGSYYGLQAPGLYSGGASLTLALVTPRPSPEPTPTATPSLHVTSVSTRPQPLKPPAPPAPFFESNTASVPPLELSLIDGFTGSKTARDDVEGMALEGHLYENQSISATSYQAETINVFARLEHDYQFPLVNTPSLQSVFAGESATLTTARAASHLSFFQFRESVAVQENDSYFAPTAGTITWLSPLSGPVAHTTISYAAGDKARYYALDLLGFRLTNPQGDIATQEGWQLSIPVFRAPGWLLTGGGETQTVSDRIAATEQGLVANYAAAIADVSPTPAPDGAIFASPIRAQRLGNVSLLSPRLGGNWLQFQFVAGFDFGTVTGCAAAPASPHASTVYDCFTDESNRGVGGLFLYRGPLSFGVSDTTNVPGNVSASAASRNLGTAGGLPGSVTAYVSYASCPQLTAAYTNAAFPTGIPLPQQGTTLSGELDYPMILAQPLEIGFGYFNEHAAPNVTTFGESGFFAVIRLTSTFKKTARCGGH